MKALFRGTLLLALCGLWACDDGGDGDSGDPAPDAATGAGGGAAGAGGEAGQAGQGGEGGAGGAVESELQSLTITPVEDLTAGGTFQFAVIGNYEDGSTSDLSAAADWASDNPDIVDFGEGGSAEIPYGGDVTITATVGDLEAELSTTVGCDYPRFPANVRLNQTVAAVRWDPAFREGNEEGTFDFRKASCHVDYKDVEAFILIINAQWCAPCIEEIRRVGPQAQGLLDAGGLILYIVLQDLNYAPITAANANRHINRLVGDDSPGVRMGSIGADPEAFFNNDAIIQAFPTSFIVRKRDMKVIADSRALQYHLDPYFMPILEDLDADWTAPAETAPLPFNSNCEEGDEEASEPNNTQGEAAVIEAGTHSGGICDREPDFYRIQTAGNWRFQIDFSAAQGDIDIALWDEAADNVARRDGQPVLSQGSGDQEVLEGAGDAVIRVYGYNAASATYTITLETE